MKLGRKKSAASLKALIAMLMIGIVAHAGPPYLPVYGPPPLRVAEAKKPTAAAAVIALEKSAARSLTNPPALLVTKAVTSADTNLPAEPLVGVSSSAESDGTFAPTVFALSEQGMAHMTPQMLATYFQPVVVGTNGGFTTAQVPMGFVPPFAHADSRAEYIVK